jgi:hypothetical protein
MRACIKLNEDGSNCHCPAEIVFWLPCERSSGKQKRDQRGMVQTTRDCLRWREYIQQWPVCAPVALDNSTRARRRNLPCKGLLRNGSIRRNDFELPDETRDRQEALLELGCKRGLMDLPPSRQPNHVCWPCVSSPIPLPGQAACG